MISVIVPFHWMKNWQFFLTRCLESIEKQDYKDYEVILTKSGKMAENTNRAIKSAKGDIIKILFMDDYLKNPDALRNISFAFSEGAKWVASGCVHDSGDGNGISPHYPTWNNQMNKGVNTIGSPSVIAFKNDNPELFNESLSWVLDCDLYLRMYKRYGPPTLLNSLDVAIGIGDHQTTNILTSEEKLKEVNYLINHDYGIYIQDRA